MLRTTRITLVIHAICLLVFVSMPIAFMAGQPDEETIPPLVLSGNYWLFCGLFICLFYVNTLLLIPGLYLQKKYAAYFTIMMLLFTGILFLKPFDRLVAHAARHEPMPPPSAGRPPGPPEGRNFPPHEGRAPRMRGGGGGQRVDIVSILLFIMVCSLGIAIRVIQQWRISEQKAVQAEAEKVTAELSLLRAQINPHFLFNTLNNIYLLASTNNEHTADAVMKLSNIMRYVTDDIRDDYVPLQNEVAFIQDYIDLQRMRLNRQATVDFTVAGDLEGRLISPLVLITFIENLFKYGISNHEPSPVTIKLITNGSVIFFTCKNRIFAHHHPVESTGIGISNTRQRLAHLYPSRHTLDIRTEDGFFTVELTLQASPT